jgi:adenosylcobinamide-GDP ribazoletransferase
VNRLLAAIRFLTVLPIPGSWGTAEKDLAGSVAMFPLIGLALGAIAGGLAYGLAAIAAPPMVAAVALIVVLMSFSGCLHLDGLSDTADGLLSSRTRERMLEIMKDSHVGPMGMIAVTTLLLAKFAALASLPPARLWPAALLMPLAGRCALVIHMALLPYARSGGLGSVFYQRSRLPAAIFSALVLAGAGYGVLEVQGLIVAAITIAVILILAAYVYRKLGGGTGDTFGAACEIAELVPALVLALWPLEAAR